MPLDAAAKHRSVEKTLREISKLKREISRNEKGLKKKLKTLERTNPLFQPQDSFESDLEYLKRKALAAPHLLRLRKEHVGDLWVRIGNLRARTFTTDKITIDIDKKDYDANHQRWPIVVRHRDYQREQYKVVLGLDREQAKKLYQNWKIVKKRGLLTIDAGDKVGLGRLHLVEPLSGFEKLHDFQPFKSFPSLKSGHHHGAAFTEDGGRLAYFSVKSRTDSYGNVENAASLSVADLVSGGMKDVHSVDEYYGYPVSVSGTGGLAWGTRSGAWLGGAQVTDSRVEDLVFTPDGKFAAVLFYGGGISGIYKVDDRKQVTSLPDNLVEATFSADGRYLAARWGMHGSQHRVFVHDLVANRATKIELAEVCSQALGSSYCRVDGLSFDPRGTRLWLTASLGDDSASRVLHLNPETQEWGVTELEGGGSIAVSPDGTTVALGGSGTTLARTRDAAVIRVIEGRTCKGLAFSPDGKYLACVRDGVTELLRTFLEPSADVALEKAISRPPQVVATVAFQEPSGNRALDALETARLVVTLQNNGEGPAYGLTLRLTPERIRELNYSAHFLEELAPGASAQVEMPIEAYLKVASKKQTLRLTFDEANGFAPPAQEVEFETRAYKKPELYVAAVGIEDRSGNGLIESGEMVTLTVRIGNRGEGTATGAYATFRKGEHVFITDDKPKKQRVGDLRFNESVDLELVFFVNDRTSEEIPLYVDLSEATGLAQVEGLRLDIQKSMKARPIERTVVAGVAESSGPLTIGDDLSIDIEQNIPEGLEKRPDAIAVVIGNRDYQNRDVPRVDFAIRDATLMKRYLTDTLGYDEANILFVENASLANFNTLFGTEKADGKLSDLVEAEKSEVFVYYSGHGAPDPKSKSAYFVPVDTDPSTVALNGYPLDLFYRKLNALSARRVTVVIDACFSGGSDKGTLIRNVSPVFIETKKTSGRIQRGAVFSSAQGDEVSSWHPKMKHSLFTYFFLKALQGAADDDEDGRLSIGELKAYLEKHVPREARRLNGRTQTPSIAAANLDEIFVEYVEYGDSDTEGCETDEDCWEMGSKWCDDGQCEGAVRHYPQQCDEDRKCEEGYRCVLDHDPTDYTQKLYLCLPDDDADES
jgi:WD40 repeat protein